MTFPKPKIEPKIQKAKKIEKKEIKKPQKESIKSEIQKEVLDKKHYKKVIAKEKIESKKEIEKEISKEKLNKKIENIKVVQKPKEQNLSAFRDYFEIEPEKKSLSSFLKTPSKKRKESNPLRELYADEWFDLDEKQKEFLDKNLNIIGQITQKYLIYPQVAGESGQEGVNIAEFYLYPNGDISEIKIIKESTYSILDKNTIDTIKQAYRDYPLPDKKTKVKIYVYYKIF